MKIDLTVVIPSLNCEAYIFSTLVSLRPLIQKGVRVVLVDGGSTDRTLEMAKCFDVEVVHCGIPGMYPAINMGIRLASTKWVTYLNGDDVVYADVLVAALDVAGKSDLLYGSIDFIDAQSRFLHHWRSAPVGMFNQLFRLIMPLPQLGTVFRKEVFDSLGGFDEKYKYAADLDFFLRAFNNGYKYSIVDSSIGAFRLHGAQLSHVKASEMGTEVDRIRSNARGSKIGGHLTLGWYRILNWRSFVYRLLRSSDLRRSHKFHSTLSFD